MEDARHYGIMSNLQSHKLFFSFVINRTVLVSLSLPHFLGILLMNMVFHIRGLNLTMLPVGANRLSEVRKICVEIVRVAGVCKQA